MSAPSRRMRPSAVVMAPAAGSRRRSLAPTTQGTPRPRAITAAWLDIPPRTVRTPRAACMPRMSSGLVSVRTRMVGSPRAAAAWAASAVKTTRPVAAPGLAARPVAKTSRGAAGSICGCRCSIRLRGSMRSSASLRVMAPACAEVDGDAHGGAAGAADRHGVEDGERAVLDGELDEMGVAERPGGRGGGGVELGRGRRGRASSSGRAVRGVEAGAAPCACGRKPPTRSGAPVRLSTAWSWPEPQSAGAEAEREALDDEAEAGVARARPWPGAGCAPRRRPRRGPWRGRRPRAGRRGRQGQGSPVSSAKNASISATCAAGSSRARGGGRLRSPPGRGRARRGRSRR